MAKRCRTFDHTADIGLEASADSPEELFEALAEGLAELICPPSQFQAHRKKTIRLAAEDFEALAVDFLSKVLVTLLTDHFGIASVKVQSLQDNQIEAELSGESIDPSRHTFHTEVKA